VVRIFKVKEFGERKKLLLLQSELHRQTLRVQLSAAHDSIDSLQRRFAILGISSVALSVGASVAGLFMAKKTAAAHGDAKPGFIGKIMSGISMFNQAKSLFTRFKRPPGDGV
jgi:hypothetical protein